VTDLMEEAAGVARLEAAAASEAQKAAEAAKLERENAALRAPLFQAEAVVDDELQRQRHVDTRLSVACHTVGGPWTMRGAARVRVAQQSTRPTARPHIRSSPPTCNKSSLPLGL
jgi:hypothetical protein